MFSQHRKNVHVMSNKHTFHGRRIYTNFVVGFCDRNARAVHEE
jgi:hypothetical protein